MQVDDLVLVSVDDHVVEPPDLFEGRLSSRAAERAPFIRTQDNGREVWMFEGSPLPNVGLNAVAGRVPEEYGLDPLAFSEMRPGCYDIDERIRDMNVNGVLGSLNFPSLAGFTGQLFYTCEDRDIAIELLRAYNDWHVDDWCGTYPGRMIPLAVPPIWDADLMAAEVRRMADKSCHAVTFSENPEKLGRPSWHSDYWDPFLAACEEVGTVDYVYQHHKAWTNQDFGDKLPSQVFNEHVLTCFIDDAVGMEVRHHLNPEHIHWECDYPHSDSTWPHAPEMALKYLQGLPDEDIDRITHRNAMANFSYDPFAHVPREQATVGALRAQATDVDTTPVSHGTGKFQDEGIVTAMTLAERMAKK